MKNTFCIITRSNLIVDPVDNTNLKSSRLRLSLRDHPIRQKPHKCWEKWRNLTLIFEVCEKFTKRSLQKINLRYFWCWIQWNILENLILNIFRRNLKNHHVHHLLWSLCLNFGCTKWSSMHSLGLSFCMCSSKCSKFLGKPPKAQKAGQKYENFKKLTRRSLQNVIFHENLQLALRCRRITL